jgi:hypothetical protein
MFSLCQRHVFFFFLETINNYAAESPVKTLIQISPDQIRMQIIVFWVKMEFSLVEIH